MEGLYNTGSAVGYEPKPTFEPEGGFPIGLLEPARLLLDCLMFASYRLCCYFEPSLFYTVIGLLYQVGCMYGCRS